MRSITIRMNTANAKMDQGDDVAATHIPCQTGPKIVTIGLGVEEGAGVGTGVIQISLVLAHGLASKTVFVAGNDLSALEEARALRARPFEDGHPRLSGRGK
jgi:hypothetical protein